MYCKWKTTRMFNFFNEFFLFDHFEVGVNVNFNVLRKYITKRFLETIPSGRILPTLSLLDDVNLKLHDKNLEGIQDDMYSVRENVMYKLSFEKFVNENPVDENEQKSIVIFLI